MPLRRKLATMLPILTLVVVASPPALAQAIQDRISPSMRHPLTRRENLPFNPRTRMVIIPTRDAVFRLAFPTEDVAKTVRKIQAKNGWGVADAIDTLARGTWKGFGAEAEHIDRFNSAARRAGQPMVAQLTRSGDKVADLVVVDRKTGQRLARYQAKYGSLDYVWGELHKPRYADVPVLVSPERLEDLRAKVLRKPSDPFYQRVRGRLEEGTITDQVSVRGVTTKPLTEESALHLTKGTLAQRFSEQTALEQTAALPVAREPRAPLRPRAARVSPTSLGVPEWAKLAVVTGALSGFSNGARVYRGEIAMPQAAGNTAADIALSQGGYWISRGCLKVLERGFVQVSIPAAAGVFGGVTTFVYDAGSAGLSFAAGDIGREEFLFEVGGAAFKGAAVGTAMAVTVAIVAGPAGWTVMVIGVGAYLVADFVYEQFRPTSRLTLDEITLMLPRGALDRPSMLETLRGSDPRFPPGLLEQLTKQP